MVAYDYGIKRNILRLLADHGCRITVVPAQTPAADVLSLMPDGVFLSNGPGDPEPCTYAIDAIKSLVGAAVPTFGICLGHQLLGLAMGARTLKMKFGHHGANHPVIELDSGRVFISSQNHGFAVDEATLPSNVRATHRSLFDGSLQGIEVTDLLRQFFLTLPTELDDAAKIDGANLFSIYARILMPLAKPALASVAVFSFFANWNNFQSALIYLNTMEKYTIPLGLRLYQSSFGQTHWNYLMAATVVSVIPPIIIFFTSQRYFVEGAVLTGVKG